MRSSIPVLVALFCVAAVTGGCSKRITGTEDDFGATKHVFVTFKNGESLDGYVAVNAKVRYGTLDRIYKARVKSLDADNIVLEDAILIQERRDFDVARQRMQTGKIEVVPRIEEDTLRRSEIEKVESVIGDKPRTFRGVAFWAYTSAVLGLILKARL